MKHAVFTRQVKQRLKALDLTYADLAEYLRVAPSTISRKMAGKSSWKHDEAEALRRFLRMEAEQDGVAMEPEDPAIGMVDRLLAALPHPDRKDIYHTIVLVVAGKQSRLKPSGHEAYRALCAFAN